MEILIKKIWKLRRSRLKRSRKDRKTFNIHESVEVVVEFYFSKPTLIRVLKYFSLPYSPLTKGRGGKWLIEQGGMGLFRSSSWGWFQSSLSAVQSISKTPNMSQQQWLSPEEILRVWQSVWVCPSSSQNTTRSKESKVNQCQRVSAESAR